MLDKEAIEEFFENEIEYLDFEIPEDITREEVVEAFYESVESEVYDWLRNNFATFFNDGDPDWESIREQMGKDEES